MKILANKATEIKNTDESQVTYSELCENCLNRTPKEGFSVTEMRDRLNVLGKVKEAKEKIKLEDAEASKLQECVKDMPWAIMHKDIVAFCDDVENMK